MKPYSIRHLILIVLLSSSSVFSSIAISGLAGSTLADGNYSMNYSVTGFYKIDEQSLVGIQSGKEGKKVPLLASLFVRLPIGGVVLPVATGDIGSIISPKLEYYWKAGGGFDWKNGKHSSLLILGGYEVLGGQRGLYAKAGILFEF